MDITLRDGEQRHIHGHVTRFGIGRNQGRYFGYEATVRPWLWFLTRTSDCRIYQNQTVQQIVESVFGEHTGIAKYEWPVAGSNPAPARWAAPMSTLPSAAVGTKVSD